MPSLRRRIANLLAKRNARKVEYARYPHYRNRPVDYIREILKQEPTPDQLRVLEATARPPYRVLVASGHSTGKTTLLAWLTNYYYDCVGPSVTITTAPTQRDVCDLLWAEVRMQRRRAGLPLQHLANKAPTMGANEEHYAKGFTSRRGESFQGRHRPNMAFFFDEAVGIDSTFWITAGTMFKPNGNHLMVAAFNPTDAGSEAYQQWHRGGWNCVSMSSLAHPNIAAELAGQPAPIPGAVDVPQIRQWLLDYFDPIAASDADPHRDVEFPPGSGKWHRPGPLGESRVLGRWPTQAVNSVWSQGLWQAVLATRHELDRRWPLAIGADIARFGDDRTCFVVRHGYCIVHVETHSGWDTARSAERLRQLCHEWAAPGVHDPRTIPCYIDSGAMGPGVIDHHDGYLFVGVNSSWKPTTGSAEDYPNLRAQLWFDAAKIAKSGLLDLSRLPHHVRDELGRELLAPTYTVDSLGRRVLESKDETKKRLRKSPDIADAFNLCLLVQDMQGERVAGHVR